MLTTSTILKTLQVEIARCVAERLDNGDIRSLISEVEACFSANSQLKELNKHLIWRFEPSYYLYMHAVDHLIFDTKVIQNWAKKARDFVEANKDHQRFQQIFSRDLDYDIVLYESIPIELGSKKLSQYVSEAIQREIERCEETITRTNLALRRGNNSAEFIRTSSDSVRRLGEQVDLLRMAEFAAKKFPALSKQFALGLKQVLRPAIQDVLFKIAGKLQAENIERQTKLQDAFERVSVTQSYLHQAG